MTSRRGQRGGGRRAARAVGGGRRMAGGGRRMAGGGRRAAGRWPSLSEVTPGMGKLPVPAWVTDLPGSHQPWVIITRRVAAITDTWSRLDSGRCVPSLITPQKTGAGRAFMNYDHVALTGAKTCLFLGLKTTHLGSSFSKFIHL